MAKSHAHQGGSLAGRSRHSNQQNFQNASHSRHDNRHRFPKDTIPSIVVQNGTKGMDRTVRTQRSLSKQEGIEEEGDMSPSYDKSPPGSHTPGAGGGSELESSRGKSGGLQSMGSSSEEQCPNQTGTNHRSRTKVKLLVRSHAVREETSPPPEPQQGVGTGGHHHGTTGGGGGGGEGQLGGGGKSESRRSHKEWQPPLSRGNSRENQFDTNNPIDLHQFIIETLNRNHKDRMLLFKIENELISLASDPKRTMHKFAQMSSYQRMLVHRVAAYFNMEHNVDTSGVAVIVNTTKTTRIPETRFRDFVREDLLLPEEPRRSILKRDSSSFDETGSFKSSERLGGGGGSGDGGSRRSKSFEEREEEYEKARRRIFNREHSFDGEGEGMEDLRWESEDNVFTHSDLPNPNQRNPRLLKVESYESGDTLRANSLRPSVAKSHSFNGYEPQPHHHHPQAHLHHQPGRVLTKQDSGSSLSSRISPSSSGYKSQRSDATLSATPSPTATPNLHTQLSAQSTGCGGGLSPEPSDGAVVWAVSDLSSVPAGSVLIHPQSGQPYTNPDGSIYHYDPNNPPRVVPEMQHSGGAGPGGHVAPPAPCGGQPQQQPQQVAQHPSSSLVVAQSSGGGQSPPTKHVLAGPYGLPPWSRSWCSSPPRARSFVNNGCVVDGLSSGKLVETGGGGGGGGGYEMTTGYLPHHQAISLPAGAAPQPTVPGQHHQYTTSHTGVHQSAPQHHLLDPHQIQFHPLYPPHPALTHQQTYSTHRIQEGVGDLSGYMMGLSLDSSRGGAGPPQQHPAAPPVGPAPLDTRHFMYWPQSHHIQGQQQPTGSSTSAGGTVYYTTAAGPGAAPAAPGPPPPPPAAAAPAAVQPRYTGHHTPQPQQAAWLPPPPSLHPPLDHTGTCYSNGYPPAECIPYAPSTVHMYYAPPYNSVPSSGGGSGGGSQSSGYYTNVAQNCGAPILAVQYPQPCPHPPSPHTPQGVCGGFAVYNSCYPGGHYSQPSGSAGSSLSVPTPSGLFRKPSLQVGVRCNSPLRGYPASPTVKDSRTPEEKIQPLPVYGFRVLPGDMRLLGNAGRLPFTLQPPPKAPHPRKHRTKIGGRPQEGYHPAGKA